MIPTPEQAWELLCEYNEGDFHRKHGRIVGDVLRWYANELGYGDEADFCTIWISSSGPSSTAQRSRSCCASAASTSASFMRSQATATR